MRISKHARARLQQRGYRHADIQTVLDHGTEGEEAVVLTDRDSEIAIGQHKSAIRSLQRLAGTAVILGEDTVITVYRPSRARLRRFLGLGNRCLR